MRNTLSVGCLSASLFFLALPAYPQPSQPLSGATDVELSQASTNSTVLLTRVNLNESLYPGRDLPYRTVINIGTYQRLVAVGVLTDWWQKRPTQIRIYEFRNGRKGALIGTGQFPTYLDRVCGLRFNRKCQVPDRRGSGTALLPVRINSTTNPSAIVVEIDGLLSRENEYVILKGINVYGRR